MKTFLKKIFILVIMYPVLSFGYPLNPTFQTESKEYGAILIDWKTTDDPAVACRESLLRAHNPNVVACAIRSGLRCTIFTKRNLDLATLGHEIRHCYEGSWHRKDDRVD